MPSVRRAPRSPFVRAAGMGALAAILLCGAASACAGTWVYDHLSWNPGGDTLGVMAWSDPPGGDQPGRRLYIPVDTAQALTVAPDVRVVQVSPDGTAALLLGDGGLWWYGATTGRLVQLRYQSPASGERVYDMGFRKGDDGVNFATGAPGDRTGAWYRWMPGKPVERTGARTPGAAMDTAWTNQTLPAMRPNVGAMRSARRVTVPGSPSIVMDYDSKDLVVATGYGGDRAKLEDVEVEWIVWPQEGARALIALRHRGDGRPELISVSGGGFHPLGSRGAAFGGWLADGSALLADADGRLVSWTPLTDSLAVVPLDEPPRWARYLSRDATVLSLAVTRWPRSARRFESQVELVKKAAATLPEEWRAGAMAYGRRLLGGDQRVGVFPTDEAARRAADAFHASGMTVTPVTSTAREMTGAFDYALTRNGPGDAAWIRRLDTGGAEVWLLRKAGGQPIRLLTREMTR
ncbi:MAG TPA: hypothetical protein VF720_07915 [Candidatus Eisenbacteria bacterium]